MSKGYFAIVQNGTHDYVRMAYALAMSYFKGKPAS